MSRASLIHSDPIRHWLDLNSNDAQLQVEKHLKLLITEAVGLGSNESHVARGGRSASCFPHQELNKCAFPFPIHNVCHENKHAFLCT